MRTSSTYSPTCLYSAIDQAGRRVEPEHARRLRLHQPVLDGHGHRADRAVAAHRQAAGRLDEQDGDVAIGPRRRIEDRARHHVVAARLEHQPGADPVIFGQEMRAPLHHGRAVEQRPAAGDQPHRIAAGVAVDAEEGMAGHGVDLRQNRCARKGRKIDRRSLPQNEVADQPRRSRRPGSGRDGRGRRHRRRSALACAPADHRQRIRQRRPKAHPFAPAAGVKPRQERLRLVEHRLRARRNWAAGEGRRARPRRRRAGRFRAA